MKGLSLLETLVAILIGSVLLTALLLFLSKMDKANTLIRARTTGRMELEELFFEIKTAWRRRALLQDAAFVLLPSPAFNSPSSTQPCRGLQVNEWDRQLNRLTWIKFQIVCGLVAGSEVLQGERAHNDATCPPGERLIVEVSSEHKPPSHFPRDSILQETALCFRQAGTEVVLEAGTRFAAGKTVDRVGDRTVLFPLDRPFGFEFVR